MDKIVLTHHTMMSGGDGGGPRRKMKRPNVYEIKHNEDLYPKHMEVLHTRYLHFKSRLSQRIGISSGFGTYLKLTEMCGRAFADLIKDRSEFRFRMNPSLGLGNKNNPKYLIRATVWGEEVRLIYDAFDMMVLTVFEPGDVGFTNGFCYHPDTIETPIVIDMTDLCDNKGDA